MSRVFWGEARRILTGAEDRPLNMNRFNHREIVTGLHGLIYGEQDGFRRKHLRILYNDGSESAPFPIVSLGTPPEVDETRPILHLGFLSGRHPALDTFIDCYVVRNRELDQIETSAEREQYVFEGVMRLFGEETLTHPWTIEAYHTGLEPVTVGFYRGVVKTAQDRHQRSLPTIPVVPMIWKRGELNLSTFVEKTEGRFCIETIRGALQPLTEELTEFLAWHVSSSGETVGIRWLLERPMWTSERDWLCRRAPSVKEVIHVLYQHTHYDRAPNWGLGIG
jgi:hypothetical protein